VRDDDRDRDRGAHDTIGIAPMIAGLERLVRTGVTS